MTRAILIIEDDLQVNQLLCDKLQDQGFSTTSCFDGEQGLMAIREKPFDLILLDVMLPKINGLEVLNQLRQLCQTPVILLTALGAEQDRIEGFKSGADDYLTKPFSTAELLLRIEAILRRTQVNTSSSQGVLKVGDLQQLELTPVEQQIFQVLVDNFEQTLSKPLLYQQGLLKNYNQYDRTLDMHISKIRKKLQSSTTVSLAITTVHGQGYRLHHV